MTGEPEYHHVAIGEGYEWQPAPPGDAALLSTLAEAALALPPGTRLRLRGAEEAFALVRHPASRLRGIRGQVVRLEHDEAAEAPRAEAGVFAARLLAALRRSAGGPLVLPEDVRTAGARLDGEVLALLGRVGRAAPSWRLWGDVPPELLGRLAGRPGSERLAVVRDEGEVERAAARLAAWCLGVPEDAPWARLRAWIAPEGDAPLVRYIDGRWGEEADRFLDELAALLQGVRGAVAVAAMLRLLGRAPAVLGSEPVRLCYSARPTGKEVSLAPGAKALVLELPRGVRSVQHYQETRELVALARALGAEGGDDAAFEGDFRQACEQVGPDTVGWWLGRGADAALLGRLIGDAELPLARPVSLVEGIRILAGAPAGQAATAAATATKGSADVRGLRFGAEEREAMAARIVAALGAGELRFGVVGGEALGAAARVLGSTLLELLAAVGERPAPAAVFGRPTLRLVLAGDDDVGHGAGLRIAASAEERGA